MPKAYSYVRFSTPEQGKGDSLRRQSSLAEKYASEHGLDLQDISYNDLGVSSYRGSNKLVGALGQFLSACESGSIEKNSYLLVENLDRISREAILESLSTLQLIINFGITIVTLQDGRLFSRVEIEKNNFLMFEMIIGLIRKVR